MFKLWSSINESLNLPIADIYKERVAIILSGGILLNENHLNIKPKDKKSSIFVEALQSVTYFKNRNRGLNKKKFFRS